MYRAVILGLGLTPLTNTAVGGPWRCAAFTAPAPLAPSGIVGVSRHYRPPRLWQPQQRPPQQQPVSQPSNTSNRPRQARSQPWARSGTAGSLDSEVEDRGVEERGSIGDSDGGSPVSAWVARGSGTTTATGEAPVTPEAAAAGPNGADGSNDVANRLLAEGAQQQEGFPISNRDGVAIDTRTSQLPLSNAPVAARDARDGATASLLPSDEEDLSTTAPSSSKGGVVVVEGSGAVGQPEQEEREGKYNAGVGNPGQAEGAAMASGAKDDDAGFGEHGWYSTSAVTEDHIGSVFSWKAGLEEEARSSEDPSSTPGLEQQEGSRSRGSGEEHEAGTDDSDWSDRRRLVEQWEEHDEVWISMREEARAAAEKEPLLVSFVYSTILNQNSLEAAVAFHLANKLAGPNMLSTQVQALVRECFAEVGTPFHRQLRRDMIAVRERDPACDSYHDCLLYFKGFQALQTHRVAHWLYRTGRHALAFYLQSQVNQEFQIDIHPGAKFGEGVFIDHGTGIVVGETTVVGNDVSMLHRVTLGGSGVQNADRHPKIGNGVLIGAGACLLGDITIGTGTQIGAGSLVVTDLPERCVAVGVPAKVLGQGRNRVPALAMGQDFFKEVWRGLDI